MCIVHSRLAGRQRTIHQPLCGILNKSHAQTAHLVFAGIPISIGTNTEKTKELFFSQRSGRNDRKKGTFENE